MVNATIPVTHMEDKRKGAPTTGITRKDIVRGLTTIIHMAEVVTVARPRRLVGTADRSTKMIRTIITDLVGVPTRRAMNMVGRKPHRDGMTMAVGVADMVTLGATAGTVNNLRPMVNLVVMLLANMGENPSRKAMVPAATQRAEVMLHRMAQTRK